MRSWPFIPLFFLVLPWQVQAHQNPTGDIHPTVLIEDGHFIVCFGAVSRTDDETARDFMNVITFSPEGKILIPRYRVPNPKSPEQTNSEGPPQYAAQVELKLGKDNLHRPVWVKNPWNLAARVEQPLPLEIKTISDHLSYPFSEATEVAGEQLGFVWGDTPHTRVNQGVQLKLSLVSLKGFTEGETVDLGEATSIYSNPTASNPVWAANRWWVAWVKSVEPSTKTHEMPWQTILSSYDPKTKKLEQKPLPGLSNWNTDISMATTGGWLCAAWHASKDGTYPGEARIVTAFEKLPEIQKGRPN